MAETANGSGIGQPVRRREDLRLVRGAGRYTADENLPGQVYAVMVRSPHAHARIRSIATDEAKAAPGVLAVLTGADFVADGLKPIPHKPWSPHPTEAQLHIKGDEPPFEAPHYPLPTDKARFRRRSGGDGRCRNRARGERRRRAGRDRLRRLAGGGRNRRGRAPGCAAGARRRAVECLLRRRARRRRGDRRRLCPRRARDAVRDLGAARHRRADGAARRARRLRCRDRPLHRLCRQRRRGAAEERSRHHARRAAGKSPRADAGRRRQFRHPRHDLRRIRAGGVGGEESSAGR